MGIHTVVVSSGETRVTVGETLPGKQWRGGTLLARVRLPQA
jgi:hypothetical protein